MEQGHLKQTDHPVVVIRIAFGVEFVNADRAALIPGQDHVEHIGFDREVANGVEAAAGDPADRRVRQRIHRRLLAGANHHVSALGIGELQRAVDQKERPVGAFAELEKVFASLRCPYRKSPRQIGPVSDRQGTERQIARQ